MSKFKINIYSFFLGSVEVLTNQIKNLLKEKFNCEPAVFFFCNSKRFVFNIAPKIYGSTKKVFRTHQRKSIIVFKILNNNNFLSELQNHFGSLSLPAGVGINLERIENGSKNIIFSHNCNVGKFEGEK